ncbi:MULTISPECIES: allantoinase AllB [Paenibacillus]|uniref:Allantoinase n=1 Tax=Paenibacillus validus TaxID=44253 RepID=A0A7X2Z9B6_9BACL|nr:MULTISPECIES: allantoinase AllB [Paenibacillus]MUG70738.1 allantoinase AllB [Paenibacillus validus]
MLDLKITGGLVVLRHEVRRLDIGVADGRIVRLAEHITGEASRHFDARGLHVLPGMVDAHVHLNEPRMGHWEGFESGSKALAAGGCTSFLDMPLNGLPPTVSVAAMSQKLRAAANRSSVDYALWGGLVPGNLKELEPLAAAGVIGFKAFMSEPGGEGEERFRRADYATLREGMKRIARLNRVLALHAEDESMVASLAGHSIREGRTGARDYAASRPISAERTAVRQALEMARETGCALHFVHISSAESVRIIRKAKDRGLDVTVETCPHYLVLTEDDMERMGPVAKCAPPLRSAEDQMKLWQAVADGKIDIIASDHSPSPLELKQSSNFFQAWGGIAGAQSSLELMVDEGHLKRGLPLPLLCRMLSLNPAVRFGLHPRKGEIAVGADADLALADLQRGYTLESGHLKQRHAYSPYVGRRFGCRVSATFVRGRQAYRADTQSMAEDAAEAGAWLRHST